MIAKIGNVHMAATMSLKVYSHRESALTITVILSLILDRNTLISIAPFTPGISISVNTNVKNQMGSGPVQKQ